MKKIKFKSSLETIANQLFPALPYEQDKIPYIVTHNYHPDFLLLPGVYLELKGRFTGSDRSKHLHVKAQHPSLIIIIIFQAPYNKLTKSSKTTYSQWCEKNSIKWLHFNKFKTLSLEELRAFALSAINTIV